MSIGSTIKITMSTSQEETEQASDVKITSNANYSTRVSESNAALYEYTETGGSSPKTINVYSGTDLLGNTLAFRKVLAMHLRNEGTSPIVIDGTGTTVEMVYGDVVLPGLGAMAFHSVYGHDVVEGSKDEIQIDPGSNGHWTIRILGTK